jgi:hypothetical protein
MLDPRSTIVLFLIETIVLISFDDFQKLNFGSVRHAARELRCFCRHKNFMLLFSESFAGQKSPFVGSKKNIIEC